MIMKGRRKGNKGSTAARLGGISLVAVDME